MISRLGAGAILLLVTVSILWPRLSRPEWQGTEGRRVQIAHEMLESGDWLVPSLNGEPTLTKPPFYYWVLAGSESLFGFGRLQARVPSVIGFWLFAWFALEVLRRRFGSLAGWIGAVGVLTAPSITYHGGYAEIDPMFSALCGASLLGLGVGLAERSRPRILIAGALGALAMLTKGPPYFLFFAGALLVWVRHCRAFALHWFLLVLLTPILIWVFVLAERVGGISSLLELWKSETVGRAAGYGWKHVLLGVPFVLGAFAQVLPLGLWTFWEHRGAREARVNGSEVILRICSASAISGVLLLLLSTGRPARYLMPGLLVFCTAVAPAVAAYASLRRPPSRWQASIPRVVGALAAIALFVLPWLRSPLPGSSFWWALIIALLGLRVRTRPQLVAYALLVPALLPWTALNDRVERSTRGVRSAHEVAVALRAEVRRLGIDEGELAFFGHVPNDVMLHADLLEVFGDEFRARVPKTRWIIHEATWNDQDAPLDRYRCRARVRAHKRTLVLSERID